MIPSYHLFTIVDLCNENESELGGVVGVVHLTMVFGMRHDVIVKESEIRSIIIRMKIAY